MSVARVESSCIHTVKAAPQRQRQSTRPDTHTSAREERHTHGHTDRRHTRARAAHTPPTHTVHTARAPPPPPTRRGARARVRRVALSLSRGLHLQRYLVLTELSTLCEITVKYCLRKKIPDPEAAGGRALMALSCESRDAVSAPCRSFSVHRPRENDRSRRLERSTTGVTSGALVRESNKLALTC